jgi:1-acyl-sn-glycerol-3-phosphate acyltransferase
MPRGEWARTLRGGVAAAFERAARVLGTGLLFAVFGIGGVLLAGVLLPLVASRRSSQEERELLAQRLVQRAFAFYLRLGTWLDLWEVKVDGEDRLAAGGALVVANHPTLLDIVLLISRMPQADCVVKREAWGNPFLRRIVTVCGYLPNDEGNAIVDACAERLRRGRSVILFPEGSRSPAHGLGPMRRGAAHVALRAGVPLLPVVIGCEPPALKRGQAWYRLPNRLQFSLQVGEPLELRDLAPGGAPPALAARQVTEALRRHFETRLHDAAA